MDKTANDIPEKFQRVINGLLNHEYTLTNDVYLEMLMSHLSGKEGEGRLTNNTCLLIKIKFRTKMLLLSCRYDIDEKKN